MKLTLKSIDGRGDLEKERIVMRAPSKMDVGQFAVIEAGYLDGMVNSSTKDCYWFPDKVVEEGDWVVLYTKAGKDKEKIQKNGAKAHFFYWEKSSSKWGGGSRVPVILQIDSWESMPPEDET